MHLYVIIQLLNFKTTYMYLKKLKNEKIHNQVIIWSLRSVFSAVNFTYILGYESWFPPKKIYVLDYKTAYVRVIFLFKELSHILWGPGLGLLIYSPSTHWKTKLQKRMLQNQFYWLLYTEFIYRTLGAQVHYVMLILYWAFLFLTLYLHW